MPTTPNNLSPLSPNGFNFTINKAAGISFYCQQVNLPGITLGEPTFSTPFATNPVPGDALVYDSLQIEFQVDEQMLNYNVLYNWIVALGFPESYDQYVTFLAGDTTQYDELAKNYSDATLEILDSNNNVVRTITFYDAFPTTLDSITFASTNEGVNYVVGSATFRFGHFKFT